MNFEAAQQRGDSIIRRYGTEYIFGDSTFMGMPESGTKNIQTTADNLPPVGAVITDPAGRKFMIADRYCKLPFKVLDTEEVLGTCTITRQNVTIGDAVPYSRKQLTGKVLVAVPRSTELQQGDYITISNEQHLVMGVSRVAAPGLLVATCQLYNPNDILPQ